MIIRSLFLFTLIISINSLFAQQSIDSLSLNIPSKYFDKVSKKSHKIEVGIGKHSYKILTQLKKQEKKMYRKLNKANPNTADKIFSDIHKHSGNGICESCGNSLIKYISNLDTLTSIIKFFNQNPHLFFQTDILKEKIGNTSSSLKNLQDKFGEASQIQQFIRERKQFLKEKLAYYDVGKYLKRYSKLAYYYSQQVKGYKELFNDPQKIEKKALAILKKAPGFKKFIEKNSMLSSVFGTPADGSLTVSLTGVQTRASVQEFIQNSVSKNIVNPSHFISNQLQSASSQLLAQKSKIGHIDLLGNQEPMPDFKPNQQKTKSFVERLEFGGNVQFGKTNNLLPTTSDLAFSLGYKLNDNSVLGVGSSYKLGLGSLSRIQFSNQGVGLRTFIDWKIKGSFYLSGGYEKNYLPGLQNSNTSQMLDTWQESGLIGISKKFLVKKRKKISFQLLFDFLSYNNIPKSQPLLFRTGWIFK